MKKSGSIVVTRSGVGSKALADALVNEGHGVIVSQVHAFRQPLAPVVREYLNLQKRAGNLEVNFSTLGAPVRQGANRRPAPATTSRAATVAALSRSTAWISAA